MVQKKLSPIQLENYKPLREIVFETLRKAILDGTLKPGERLMEVQMAEDMGVSRTPVREAIRKLELEGLVLMIPRKGAYVSGISSKDIADVFEVRASLESLAAGLAAERIGEEELEALNRMMVQVTINSELGDMEKLVQSDTDFHEQIYRASRNLRLVQIIHNLRDQIQRFRSASLAHPGRIKETLEEHKNLLEAISQRDIVAARRLAQEHIENAESSIMDALEGHPELLDEGPKDLEK